jgi:Ca2+-binding RTX toxin-like protein
MPFGGMLGSTFNYVFENQLEKLQNGDRFYYLERVSALNFLTELEGNSFARLIMANTDATHLPGNVFTTPAFVLEVDRTNQYNEGTGVLLPGPDGILGTADDVEDTNADPVNSAEDANPLELLVIRDNPATAGADANYLEYTGTDHVVLGGTAGNDILLASIGDDTLWGDAGNDRLDGGYGVDFLFGGAGDDIITDPGGEDNLQGGDGNDAINGGNGIDLIIAGFGNDFVVTGEDGDETFAGPGNDFILGDAADEMVFGNEGDDWIEGGMADGSAGENFDARGLDAIVGNDVFIDSMFPDRMNGEGGDDIMVGSMGGQVDRFLGGSGFDWASFQGDEFAADVDLSLRAFDETPVPFSIASALQRFESTEGLSGSGRSDVLRGDDEDITTIPFSGTQGSTLTNFALIDGLQELVDGLLGPGQTSFAAGNIILGGGGSDIVEGRGGDDLIDGDHWLSVEIAVHQNIDGTGPELFRVKSMTELVDRVFSGEINPGQLVIAREILPDEDTLDFDTAQFSDLRANYEIRVDGALVTGNDIEILDGQVVTVSHIIDDDGDGVPETPGIDGSDTLRHIERLTFADSSIVLREGLNAEPVGLLTILADGQPVGTPVEGQTLTVSIAGVNDADNVSTGGAIPPPVSYVWQVETRPGTGIFEDIIIATGLGDVRAAGTTFTVTNDVAGLVIRVKALYEDEHGVLETVLSAPTAPVQNVNAAPTGVPTISDTTPTENQALTAIVATIIDPDGTDTAATGGLFTFRWEQSADGITWVDAANPDGPLGPDDGTGQLFFPGAAQIGLMLRVRVTFTDDGGTVETVVSPPTQPVADDGSFIGTDADDVFVGSNVANFIFGEGGNDTLSGLGGSDAISGGDGNDTLDGGEGDDFLSGGAGDDLVDGGLGADIMDNDAGNDTFVVDDPGDIVQDLGDDGVDTIRTSLGVFALDSSSAVENLTFTGAGSFTGTGNELDNVITGGAGGDTLEGGLGNDTLDGGAGADALTGGDGNDTYIVDHVGDTVAEGSGGGTDTVRTQLAAYTLGANVENLQFTGTGGFTGTGNALNNAITSGDGNDTLIGGGGGDYLVGGAGNDYVEGGDGGDSLLGGLGNDYLTGGDGNDYVEGGDGSDGLVGGAGNDYLTGGAQDDYLEGGAGSDGLVGDAGNDYILGGSEDDYLNGGDGGDSLFGGVGNDYLVGGAGNDYIEGNDGGDSLFGNAGTDYLVGGAGNDYFEGGDDADGLIGGIGNDHLVGGAGNDYIEGGDGADGLVGGAGNDHLVGGTGNDVFLFAAGFGNDAIADFDANSSGGQDFLDVTALGITAANFASLVSITDLGNDTLITIGADSVTLLGVSGSGANKITQQDFFLA